MVDRLEIMQNMVFVKTYKENNKAEQFVRMHLILALFSRKQYKINMKIYEHNKKR